jgi:hypothetical protein
VVDRGDIQRPRDVTFSVENSPPSKEMPCMLVFRKDPFDGVHSCDAVKEDDESDVVM